MRLTQPFIQLPFRFDAQRLAQEAERFAPDQWMAHPSGLAGNSAIALISSGGGDNNAFEGAKAATPHLDQCPYVRQVMSSFGEVLSRSRLMRLEAGAEVGLHVDFNYHWFSRVRIHIPVLTQPQVIFHCGEASVHMAAGECWLFDSWRRHRVVNGGDRRRIHLVIDTCGSARFWDMVQAAAAEQKDRQAPKLLPYAPGPPAPLRLEQFSNPPVMAPGECAALIEDLIADFSANRQNDPTRVQAYARLMRGFAQDWRALWLTHGHRREGFAHYRRLIEDTRARLHPDRRALTTASNRIGVNAVFAQRVLNAALDPEAQLI